MLFVGARVKPGTPADRVNLGEKWPFKLNVKVKSIEVEAMFARFTPLGLFATAALQKSFLDFKHDCHQPFFTHWKHCIRKCLKQIIYIYIYFFFGGVSLQQNDAKAMTLRITFNIPQNKITSFLRLFYCSLALEKNGVQLQWEVEEPPTRWAGPYRWPYKWVKGNSGYKPHKKE